MGSLTYRPEIDGLRAVAVIPVVLYHLNPALVPGGFMGVDVFFVISGFLITSIILREHEAGTFTLRAFWMRRIRRLFPALAALLVACTVAGYFILYDQEWRSLGSQLVAVLLLIANLHMWKETGDYWGQAAETLPLLHTWSLAVEEQFYLLFPLLVLLLLRIGRRCLLPVLLTGALVSLAHCVVSTGSNPSAAFYLLPARAWELLLGCLLAAWTRRRVSSLSDLRFAPILAAAGLLLVIASYFTVRGNTGFPGFKALLPTLGTVLVIAFSGSRGPLHALLSNAPMVYVGKISYSLYLWHWPIIVYWKLYTMEDVSAPRHAVPIFLASLLAASASYHFVESTFRHPAYPLRSPKGAAIVGSFLALFALSFVLRGDHLRPQTSQEIEAATFTAQDYNAARDEAWKSGGIRLGPEPPRIVVIGSSHAIMYGSTIASIAREQGQGVSFFCQGNVFGRFHTEGDDAIYRDGLATQRAEFDRVRLEFLERWTPGHVIWIGRWDNQYEILGPAGFDQRLRASLALLLQERAAQVHLLTQNPFCMERPGSVVRFANTLLRKEVPLEGREEPERATYRAEANEAIRRIAADLARVEVVETPDLFELEDGAVRLLTAERQLLYHDDNHLSDLGAALVRDRLAASLTMSGDR